MKLYDEDELQTSIEAGERKLASARQRQRQSRRRFVWVALAAVLLVPLTIALGIIAGRAPEAPLLVLTWPKPKVEQAMLSGQTVLMRRGQPFTVSVVNAEAWDVTWHTGSVQSKSTRLNWAPTNGDERLTAQCRPLAKGTMGLFTWLWPTREVSLKCVEASEMPRGEGEDAQPIRILSTEADGAWIYPDIFAAGEVSWDERALPLLASSASLLPEAELNARLASQATQPAAPTWQIVSDFEGLSKQAPTEGTFALLRAKNLETVVPQVATQLIQKFPDLSLKFIIRLDKDPAEGIMRLAFDGNSQRLAWVRRPGARAGTPLTGWEDGKLGSLPLNLPPDPPRRRR